MPLLRGRGADGQDCWEPWFAARAGSLPRCQGGSRCLVSFSLCMCVLTGGSGLAMSENQVVSCPTAVSEGCDINARRPASPVRHILDCTPTSQPAVSQPEAEGAAAGVAIAHHLSRSANLPGVGGQGDGGLRGAERMAMLDDELRRAVATRQ